MARRIVRAYRGGVQPLLIFGLGGHAKVVLDALVRAGRTVAGVIDDSPEATGRSLAGLPVIGTREDLKAEWRSAAIIPAIGGNRHRAALLHGCVNTSWKWPRSFIPRR